MHQEFLMGNEAIAMGAIAAGVNLVAGYPGTPSTEVLETIAKRRPEDTYVEWSINEKVAMEVGAGAAYAGARVMVTMKQVGLNVAADPLMSLEYIGVKGGMVVLVADDPGPISSQTEQDTRHFSQFSKLPCFDPSTVQEAYEMVQDAFEYSEKYKTPVFLRSTTRVSHGYAAIEVQDETEYKTNKPEGFIKDTKKWVIFPKLSYQAHINIEARNVKLAGDFSDYSKNMILNKGSKAFPKKGIAAGGFNYTYVTEALKALGKAPLLKVSTPHPFPEELAVKFLTGLDEVLCVEELDPVIERELIYICGKYQLPVKIYGKLTLDVKNSGENSLDSVMDNLAKFLGAVPAKKAAISEAEQDEMPELPVRPPVLCAGCPHRGAFYAVKQAMKGKKTIFCGDIGCYTMGNAMPLDMVDTCLCMGAGLGIAQGVNHIEPDTSCFAFVGDSTFFAASITGVINAVYNQANMTLIVLDNSTTAMTGHQPHPGTGRTMMGDVVNKVSIEGILKGIGLEFVETVNPLDHKASVDAVKRAAALPGVKAIIFKSPCIAIVKSGKSLSINQDKCINCRKCIREIGCPGLVIRNDRVIIDDSLCTGCGLCSQICPVEAIGGEADE
ncbi:MAG: indolepyruvate ferredoxin oxidoreductase subunit alpha [Anaerovibrio sp.]|uniref:indolepyruvate ferredoxin oxidoreductase subunit alpha n=1 Tax=Anaerovibrio sp. TaxID=1872532 RepID=UPI0025BD74D4|nr:indolepyruvate ferredoxin oxidoreductase subunit alpha [Anaerovibrio sp.]MBE6099735.1 indolepyruvate ferredoxin oxidoreductase subunit alpha [Anaerovibrio sp.]